MIEPVLYSALRVGQAFLISDLEDTEYMWSLWQRLDSKNSKVVVGWDGTLKSVKVSTREWIKRYDFKFYPIAREQIDGLVMLAHHAPDKYAWFRCAQRFVTNS